ncbi:MAG: signal recognition particle-docking protein FtsY [Candidatus Nanoarchaeia archaeon]|nr:signal recognition particle-docking protein FtsY [Candidatus Nanoarchaeia archaeon]MDD5588016.1 signal recognition particle-docking protein FtsY [Candidatus Nanoarchaeia archaeon]
MFGLFKDKLKKAISSISDKLKKVEEKEDIEEVIIEKPKKEKRKKEKKEVSKPIIKEEIKTEEPIEEVKEKKGFFARLKEKVTTSHIDEAQFEELFWELEVILLENNVAVEVIEKIKHDLKKDLVEQPIERGKIDKIVRESLKNSIENLFKVPEIDLIQKVKTKKPFVIVFVGVNGSGKTTTIAKVAHLLKKHNLSCVLVAGDTWRAASIEQLKNWAEKLKVNVIANNYGSDPAAVAFDGIKHAEAKGIDVVLIDTAGRQHGNVNLMQEMEKIIRVAKPDMKILIAESIVGNDCVEQAKNFDESIGLDGVILTKADVDEKGGAMISISFVTQKPILYLGMGQELDDLKKFDSKEILDKLGI